MPEIELIDIANRSPESVLDYTIDLDGNKQKKCHISCQNNHITFVLFFSDQRSLR
jgi:hypothetical protein